MHSEKKWKLFQMKENFTRKVLKNGMVLLFEKRDLPVVSMAFAVKNGGINENEKDKGISHYIEHMLYKGTEKRTALDIAEEIERNGGILNGFTDEVATAYWCKMPGNSYMKGFEVLMDMVRNPKFNDEELEKERHVIFEEIKMRRDNPRIHVIDEAKKYLYEEPFGSSLIGTEETMNSIDRKKIIERFEDVYVPENMIFCIVGNADIIEIEKLIEEKFEIKDKKIENIEIKKRNDSKIEERNGLDQANSIFVYHVPLANDEKSCVAKVLSVLMAGGMSSRLFAEIREKRNLAYAIKGDSEITKDFAYNMIYAGSKKENVEKIKELILEEFEKVSVGLEEGELEAVKNQMIGNHYISMEDSESQMVNLIYSEIDGDVESFYDFKKKVLEVELEDVKELASEVKKGYGFYAVVPKD